MEPEYRRLPDSAAASHVDIGSNRSHIKRMRNEELAYEAGYRVDEDGNIYGVRGHRLVGTVNNNGYPKFRIKKRGPNVEAHRLAAFQWFGAAMFEAGVQVRHLDGNPANNRRDNLALGTASDNCMDKLPTVRLRATRMAAAVVRKLTDEQAEQLRADRAAGAKYSELSDKYRLSKSTISYICNRKTYSGVAQ